MIFVTVSEFFSSITFGHNVDGEMDSGTQVKGHLLTISIVGLLIVHILHVRYNTPLRRVPGPFLASLTRLWKVWTIFTTRQELNLYDLHQKYGEL